MTTMELSELLRRISKYQWESLRWMIDAERERMVLTCMCRNRFTLAKTAIKYKVTPERIRQIYHKALRKLNWRIKKLKALGEYDFILNPKPIVRITDESPAVKLDLSLEYLELPERVRNCFRHTGQKTLREIVSMTENELLAIKCFGPTSLCILKKRLSDIGLKLRGEK